MDDGHGMVHAGSCSAAIPLVALLPSDDALQQLHYAWPLVVCPHPASSLLPPPASLLSPPAQMSCGGCGAYWCWRCGKEIDGYKHFRSGDCILFDEAEILR